MQLPKGGEGQMTRTQPARRDRRVPAVLRRIGGHRLAGTPHMLIVVCSVLLASHHGNRLDHQPVNGRRRGNDHVHGLRVSRWCDGAGPHR